MLAGPHPRSLRPRSRPQALFPVVIGEGSHPFPFRTRKLSPLPPMVLRGPTAWESRSLPGLFLQARLERGGLLFFGNPVARFTYGRERLWPEGGREARTESERGGPASAERGHCRDYFSMNARRLNKAAGVFWLRWLLAQALGSSTTVRRTHSRAFLEPRAAPINTAPQCAAHHRRGPNPAAVPRSSSHTR